MKILNGILRTLLIAAFLFAISCSSSDKSGSPLDEIAESYVKLALRIGQYDANFIDAYYGPAEWKPAESGKDSAALPELADRADQLITRLRNTDVSRADELIKLRKTYLEKQLLAARGKISLMSGAKMTFDEESRILYDAVAPEFGDSYFDNILDELDSLLPGEGEFSERYGRFRSQFVVPPEKVDTVFRTAIAECRRRTKQHIQLPEGESFNVEYVSDKSWGAYNWYKGNYHSVIQVNTDLPVYADRVIHLASHEGYPGHHVYNSLLEDNLLNGRKWIEFSVYLLFSPQSLIAEGTANYGMALLFPDDEQTVFEKEILFPLAGLDPSQAEQLSHVNELKEKLAYAENEVARNYLDGKTDKEAAIKWLMKYSLSMKDRAEKLLSFIETYRSYIINYNLGQDIIKEYISRSTAPSHKLADRWLEFEYILSTPQTPSGLRSAQ